MTKLNKEKYFSHDYGASNDIKIQLMTNDLGMEGYGIYWYIVEQLANNEGYLPMSFIPIIAKKANVEEIKVRGVIESYDLFIIGDGKFYTQRLLDHLDKRKELQEAGKRGAAKRWKNSQIADNQYQNRGAIGGANGNPIANKSKGKEIKVKDDNIEAPKKISLGVQEMAEKYLTYNQEQVDLIQMNVLRQKNIAHFKNLLWAFCLEQIGKVNEHTSYKDFCSHVWNWFNHPKFNAEQKLKLIK